MLILIVFVFYGSLQESPLFSAEFQSEFSEAGNFSKKQATFLLFYDIPIGNFSVSSLFPIVHFFPNPLIYNATLDESFSIR